MGKSKTLKEVIMVEKNKNTDSPSTDAEEPVTAPVGEGQASQDAVPGPNWAPYAAPAPGQGHEAQGAAPGQQPQEGAPVPPPPPQGYGQAQQPYYTPYEDYQGAPPQPGPQAPPQQPYYYQQAPVQPVVSSKDHVAAGLLGIFLGSLGIHKFYLGYNTAGFIMLAVTILGSILTLGLAAAVMGLIGLIEGILYLTKTQSEFEYLYVFNKREWF